jgi:hypothetical protein
VAATWVDPQVERAVAVLDGEVGLSDLRPKRATTSRG